MGQVFTLAVVSTAAIFAFALPLLASAQVVTTNPATSVTPSDATMNGTVGVTGTDQESFWVSTSTIDTSTSNIPAAVYSTPPLPALPAGSTFSDALSLVTTQGITASGPSNMAPITPNTTYYFVAWGNIAGTWTPGAVLNFTTLPVVPPPSSSSQTIVVHSSDLDNTSSNPAIVIGDGLNKWFAYDDTNDTINNSLATFVAGPATSTLGIGSIAFTATSSLYRGNIATYQFASTSLANITALSYSAYSHSGVSGPNESPYLAFNVDFNGSNTWQHRLVYVPSANMVSVPQDTWNTFDTIHGGSGLWVYSGTTWPAPNTQPGSTPKTWSQILTDYPNASILASDGWLGVRVGEPGPAGYTGNVDKVVVGVLAGSNATTTTFDFEPVAPPACSPTNTFDTFTNGSVNGQGGWVETNASYDQAVVPNIYGYASFGCKTLRISDAVTSGAFDWIFTPSSANEAGETAAATSTFSGGTRQTHYEAQFDLASAVPGAQQPNMYLSVSPDRGDGARMSYLRFVDGTDGIDVFFDDASDAGPVGTTASFNETEIAGGLATTTALDRTVPHTITFAIDFVDGPANDIVNIYIDGALVHTGTTWEDYYRYDPEQAGSGNQVPTVDSLILQTRTGSGPLTNPGNAGKGFLVDNFSISTGPTDTTPPVITLNGSATINLTVGDTYTELGATATDNVDPVVNVSVGGSVDTSTVGSYSVTYDAVDVAGNHATQVIRTVVVSAPTPTPTPPSPVAGNGPVVGGGGGGGGVTAVALPFNGGAPGGQVLGANTSTVSTTSNGGQVLGASTFFFANDLTIGSTGNDVVELQKLLISLGFPIPLLTSGAASYGYFGEETRAAVSAFQIAHGITPTAGYFGPITRAAINQGTQTLQSLQLQLQSLLAQIAALEAGTAH